MRRIIKMLRKGLKTACISAALVTCWNVGQTADAALQIGDEVTVRFSGTVLPTVHDLSHVFLIYGTGYSSIQYALRSVKLGDFTAGISTPFSVSADVVYNTTLWWYVAGLYGDVSGGQYSEGINGVTLGIGASEGDSWETSFSYSLDESTAFEHLFNDHPDWLPSFGWYWDGWDWTFGNGMEINEFKNLYDFSSAGYNGEIHIQSQIVPEPVTILLLGSGGLFLGKRRRLNE